MGKCNKIYHYINVLFLFIINFIFLYSGIATSNQYKLLSFLEINFISLWDLVFLIIFALDIVSPILLAKNLISKIIKYWVILHLAAFILLVIIVLSDFVTFTFDENFTPFVFVWEGLYYLILIKWSILELCEYKYLRNNIIKENYIKNFFQDENGFSPLPEEESKKNVE